MDDFFISDVCIQSTNNQEKVKVISENCTECSACKYSCPKKAISFIINNEGFSYPEINQTKCIDCSICKNICPVLNTEKLVNKPRVIYAAQINDNVTLSKSSSGGMFYLFASYALSKGGVVYGAAWDKNMKNQHIEVDNLADLNQLLGSKYVQSDIGDSYLRIKERLKSGRIVYFSGTPCQVAGLKSFLKKDYENLITSDIICHGTPSQKIFDVFLQSLRDEYKADIVNYFFRDKSLYGWSSNASTSIIKIKRKRNGKELKLIYNHNMRAYYNAFLNGDISRLDCYSCPFAKSERTGDFTIGDYWDIEKIYSDFPNIEKGVSVITINTEKGMKLWLNQKSKCTYKESSVEDLLKTCNKNFFRPTPMPNSRKTSYNIAFTNFEKFRDFHHTKKEENDFKKIIIKKRMRKYWLLGKILDLIGK